MADTGALTQKRSLVAGPVGLRAAGSMKLRVKSIAAQPESTDAPKPGHCAALFSQAHCA